MKTMQKGFTLIELMIVVAIIAILAAIAIPAYQNYLIRAQVAEGMSLMGAAKTGVAEYYGNYGGFPGSNLSAGIATDTSISGNYVSKVAVSTGGLITATFNGPKVNTNIAGKTLILSPIANVGSINWTCSTTSSISQQYLPATCR
ncbi:pilin [Metallibacterium scheffleri]|uniref:Prepilin-type cleavage/methylation domain-containing protein n=1 Tax=Metallibacterium scheffleri TaxID=993689 RepID=A0A4V3UTP4_9GAMM|nr:pilin [Metallibacterium scheffleri]THD11401.1 prepilin-type cleavage/methylation domain-containing protein [Metallibacterium scheffleri]